MAYNEILDSEVQPEAPITSSLGFRFRDNPLSIAAREVGAPHMAPPRIVVLEAGTSGNWTVPDDCYGIRVTCVGGGGGATRGPTSSIGGAGAVVIANILDLTPGSTIAYSVGSGGAGVDGGDTTFGALSAGGGKEAFSGNLDNGGTASGGDINIDGQDGRLISNIAFGGSTMFGQGGVANDGFEDGHGYGSGAAAQGSGGVVNVNGGPGVIIIEY